MPTRAPTKPLQPTRSSHARPRSRAKTTPYRLAPMAASVDARVPKPAKRASSRPRSRAKTAPRLLAPVTNMASKTTFASRSRVVPRPLTAPTPKPGGTLLRRLSTSQSLPSHLLRSPATVRPITPGEIRPSKPTVAAVQMDMRGQPNVTSVDYWDGVGEEWNDEIHDSLAEDLGGVAKAAIAEFSAPDEPAIDFGCGVGKYLPLLASHCSRVVGLDISRRLLAIARKELEAAAVRDFRLHRADLGASTLERLSLPQAGLAICVNVLISPEPCTRDAILANIAASVRPGGHLVLVVPSVRSAVLQRAMLSRWHEERRRRKLRAKPAFDPEEATCAADEAAGVFCREGVRTKHFREDEVRRQLRVAGFDEVVAVRRVEYAWHTEFPDTLDFLDGATTERPHDLLVVARRAQTRGGANRAGGGGAAGVEGE